MTTTEAKTILDRIQKSADSHDDRLRFVRTIEVGQWVRQGDVEIARIADDHGLTKTTNDRQLAPGTTKGSRHVVHGDVRVYPRTGGDVLEGPIVQSGERLEVQHPEHANISLPSGCYAVTYQRDYAKEERARVYD